MERNASVRLRSGIAAPATHDGPTPIIPANKNKFYANPNVPLPGTWQTIFLAPWHYPRGQGDESAPSLWTSLFALVLTFISALTYGWVFTTTLDQSLVAGVDAFNQAFVLGLVSASMFVLTMEWTWEPLLPTQVNFGLTAAMIGTFDLGVLPFLAVAAFQMGGFAASGGIVSALGIVNTVAGVSLMPVAGLNGRVLYWFAGTMVIFSYIFLSKFIRGEADDETQASRRRRATIYAGLAMFAFTMAFRRLGLYYFDAGLYVASWAATGLSNPTADGIVDWAFYLLVPLASAATALLLYYIVQLSLYGSDLYDTNQKWGSLVEPSVNSRARYAPRKNVSVFE